MSTVADSYVSRVLFAVRPVYSLGALARRWRRLRTNISDPYRPELHYMRGPGPKWRQEHGQLVPPSLSALATSPRQRFAERIMVWQIARPMPIPLGLCR